MLFACDTHSNHLQLSIMFKNTNSILGVESESKFKSFLVCFFLLNESADEIGYIENSEGSMINGYRD